MACAVLEASVGSMVLAPPSVMDVALTVPAAMGPPVVRLSCPLAAWYGKMVWSPAVEGKHAAAAGDLHHARVRPTGK